jgi:hypothetical protein
MKPNEELWYITLEFYFFSTLSSWEKRVLKDFLLRLVSFLFSLDKWVKVSEITIFQRKLEFAFSFLKQKWRHCLWHLLKHHALPTLGPQPSNCPSSSELMHVCRYRIGSCRLQMSRASHPWFSVECSVLMQSSHLALPGCILLFCDVCKVFFLAPGLKM